MRCCFSAAGDGYGDYFGYYTDYAALAEAPQMAGRVFFTFYETMKTDFEAEVCAPAADCALHALHPRPLRDASN
eukprot:COSAG01_NODE_21564_length_896_cov_1.110414_2_plen_74_part_00